MNSKPRFAIIGCGNIAPRHAAQAVKHGELIAVCDIISGRAEELADEFGGKPYDNLDSLLSAEKKLDIVTVCTPNGLHAAHSIQALKAGCDVLCEKPMAISSEEGRQMIAVAAEMKRKLYVVKQNRFNPPVAFLKKLLDENKLGRIFSFQLNCFWNRPLSYYADDWHGTLKMDGGTLFTQFSHFIDLLYWLLGEVEETNGIRSNYIHQNVIEFEDTGLAWMRMKNGAIGSFHYTINSYNRNMEGSLSIFGEKGTVKVGGQYLNELEWFAVDGESTPVLPKANPSNAYAGYQGSMSNHDKVYELLMRSFQDPSSHAVTAEEAIHSIGIIEKIYRSSPLL